MRLKINRIVKHHARGLGSVQPDAYHATEIELNCIRGARIARTPKGANVIVTDAFNTDYIIGNFSQSEWSATRLANAIIEQDHFAIRHHAPILSIVRVPMKARQVSMLQSLREREKELRLKREKEFIEATKDVVGTLSADELEAIEADDVVSEAAA